MAKRTQGKNLQAKVVRQLNALARFTYRDGNPKDPAYVDYVNRKLHDEERLRAKLGLSI